MERQPCTCAPDFLCPACRAWGEKPYAPRVPPAGRLAMPDTEGAPTETPRQRCGRCRTKNPGYYSRCKACRAGLRGARTQGRPTETPRNTPSTRQQDATEGDKALGARGEKSRAVIGS